MGLRVKRPIRIEGDLAYVPLTKGYEAIIDAADVPLVEGVNWTLHTGGRGGKIYAYRKGPSPERRTLRLHRVLLDAAEGVEVDHRDGDGLNNRRSNLRLATSSQNKCNQKRRKDNTSGFRGVVWDKQAKRWYAYIKLHGKRKLLGRFHSPEEAHEAYKKASAEVHGEFGRVG
jgi:HNH endonuclease/AP2 domain